MKKQLGVWLDHGKAHLIDYHNGKAKMMETIDSPYETQKRIEGEENDKTRFTTNPEHASNNEYRKHNIEQNELNEYFKLMEGKISSYQDILIFGPGTAKEKFRNRLRDNKAFDNKWLSIQTSDKLTENQLIAFVRDFFDKENPQVR